MKALIVDDSEGLLEMKNQGAATIAQNKDSCVVYGMPKVAVENGAVDCEEDLQSIPQKMLELAAQNGKAVEK